MIDKKEESMVDNKSLIGKKIISIDFGVGNIIDVKDLYDNNEEFIQVEFSNFNMANYFSVKNNNKYRIISTANVINEAVEIFKSKNSEQEFSSIQEKIKFYKVALQNSSVCGLARTLSSLSNDTGMHHEIKKYYKKALNSFCSEIEFVLEVNEDEVKKVLGL